jgi:hypothetical protein
VYGLWFGCKGLNYLGSHSSLRVGKWIWIREGCSCIVCEVLGEKAQNL